MCVSVLKEKLCCDKNASNLFFIDSERSLEGEKDKLVMNYKFITVFF